jgi:hypothetical protein
MSTIFTLGQTVWTEASHQRCEIVSVLGEGGQGAVYQVSIDGRPAAVKWYHPQFATREQKAGLETLVKKGPPTGKFLWPIELVSKPGTPGFGYLMPLRDARYKGISDLMKRRIDPAFRALATAGFELAHSFLQLHSKGLCYRDISFGNVFFDPGSGEILIGDNDNVAIDGDTKGGILGTPRFMAPEVVRGDALPSIQTDLYSLAVLLFYIFVVHHPLEGQKELAIHSFDLPAMTMLYGTEPVFIYDPHVPSNRPVQGIHDNALFFWPIYPQFLRDLFIKSFTDGIRDSAHGRIREGEWRAAMIRLRDSIHYCQHCSAENFCQFDALGDAGGRPGICWNCNRHLRPPFRIRLGKHLVMLNHDTALFPHHADDQSLYDFTQPIAAVTRHPQSPDVWGLKNLSDTKWSSRTAADPVPADVPPGMSVTLQSGTLINFGKVEGQIII